MPKIKPQTLKNTKMFWRRTPRHPDKFPLFPFTTTLFGLFFSMTPALANS
jgi:hypothetical protein